MADQGKLSEILPLPSTSTPFFRRLFVNEGRREEAETRALYEEVAAQANPFPLAALGQAVYNEFYEFLSEDIQEPFIEALNGVIAGERYMFECPPPPTHMTLREFADYRNFLRQRQYFLAHHQSVAELAYHGLVRIFAGIAERLPASEAPSPFTIPLIYALPEPKLMVDKVYGTLVEPQYAERGLFASISSRMYELLCKASGRTAGEDSRKPWKNATDNDTTLDKICEQYLKGTPFFDLFTAPVPLKFTHHERFEHMHVIGGTGAGKTSLLENLILHDLAYEDTPGLIVIDSQGDLIRKLSHLAVFEGKLRDRLIYVTPKDIEYPPALNVFDVNRERLGMYSDAIKEQVVAGVIQTFDYLFAGLLGADLTAKQGIFFKYVARLMLALPETLGRNATILDMLNLMQDPSPYAKAIESLPSLQRDFFTHDFANKTFAPTREQIRYRLQGILENPTLARLFTSARSKLDLFEEMNRSSIILVDTAKDFLKGAHSHFGRIFISLVLQATLERAALADKDRRDTFLIVDEAASYFDQNIDDLLTDARKFRLGCVFAHQYLEQATQSLRASLAANTSIKFASGLSASDARHLATDMRTTPDFILNQPKLQFAAHIRHVTPQAVSIPVYPGLPEQIDQMSESAYRAMIERNRERVSVGRGEREYAQPPQPADDGW